MNLLIIDDEATVCTLLAKSMRSLGWSVFTAKNGAVATYLAECETFDLIISDIRLPDIDGLELVQKLAEHQPGADVIVMTALVDQYSFLRVIEAGATDYLEKPFKLEELYAKVYRIGRERLLRDEVQKKTHEVLEQRQQLNALTDAIKRTTSAEGQRQLDEPRCEADRIIGNTPKICKLRSLVETVASLRVPVLITGESGTGKELLARAIHFDGCRSDKPFVAVNAGALTESILESELFGHEKGAFTGATSAKPGLLNEANGGSLFLDEIGETSTNFQVKLLRVIEEGNFRRVGGSSDISIDVRIIAATNADLEARIADGSFRQDLFYRLNVMRLTLPPLRERIDDLPMLCQHFVAKYARGFDKPLERA